MYIPALATGFALYWQSILGWLIPYFGGYNQTIYLHFWTGIGVALFSFLIFVIWRGVARWTAADSGFVRNLSKVAVRPDQVQPEDTGFFNGGQKLYFWSVIGSGVVLLLTGIVWCFRYDVPHPVYAVCRTTHRILAVIMLGGFFVHIYKATIGEPGTLRSMLRGTVSAQWARARRPKWFRDLNQK